jgi:hypothetical protein
MNDDMEMTNGRDDAAKAVRQAKESSRQTDALIVDMRLSLASIKASRESNHFADKFRAILQGGH